MSIPFIKKIYSFIIVPVLMFAAFRMSASNAFFTLYNMEPFDPVEALILIFPYSMFGCLLCLLLVFFVYSTKDTFPPLAQHEKVCCLLFALCVLAGFSIDTMAAFAVYLFSIRMQLACLVFWAGTYHILCYAFRGIRLLIRFGGSSILSKGSSRLHASAKKYFLIRAGILFLCWLPFVIIRYPAGFEWDGYHQIADFLDGTMTTHWPPASSAFMGSFVLLGMKLFDSTDIGIFVYCLLQILLGGLVFSFSLSVMEELGVPLFWRRLSFLVYAFVPIYPGYISSVVKDAPFALSVLLFLLLTARGISGKDHRIRNMIFLTLTGILVCILRNNGIFILGAILLVLIIASIVRRRVIMGNLQFPMLAAIVASLVYFTVLIPFWGIPKGSIAEALSAPFQQTARLATYHMDSITPEEQAVINEVLNLDVISTRYDPKYSDNVKGTFHADGLKPLFRYFGVWFRQGLRHPDIYIDSLLENTCGFYYPDVQLGNSNVVSGIYSTIMFDRNVRFSDTHDREQTRIAFRNFYSVVEKLPFVFPFVNIAIQLWIPVYLAIYALAAKKRRLLFLVIPSIISILVCLTSPTYDNNGARYAIPIVYANMFLLGLRIKETE